MTAPEAPAGATSRFIPFRRRDLVDMLAEDGGLAPADQERFRPLAHLLGAVFHHEFHDRLEELKDAYAPFDPDPDTRTVRTYSDAEREAARDRMVEGLRALLDDGNFERVTDEELDAAFHQESLLDLELAVDHDDFEQVLFFRRGETTRQEEVRHLFGLRRRTVTFTNYEKVLVLVTFRGPEHFADRDEDGLALPLDDDLPFEPGSTILKLFQDVPAADLEMLFPNAEPRMRRTDKLLIGVPALISGIIVVSTKLLTTLGLLVLLGGFLIGVRDEPVELDQATLVTLGAGLASVGGYLTRQFTKFKSRKVEFMRALADNLYFRNLDNDVGVFHHLVDAAEEEEVKEALLGWYFLRVADRPLARTELDDAVEGWLAERWECLMDFEVDDGLDKLRMLRLVEDADDSRLVAVDAAEAMRRLDQRWDAYFEYPSPTG